MKTLIIGVDGLLGSYWNKKFKDLFPQGEIVGTSRKHQNQSSNLFLDLNKVDLTKFSQILDQNKPQVVAYLVGLTSVEDCESKKSEADLMNTAIPAQMAEICKKNDIQFVYISTDHLYANKQKMFTEEDPTDLVNYYAFSKKAAEDLILQKNNKALILRTNFYGKSLAIKPSFTDWIESNSLSKNEISIANDVYFNPVYMGDLVTATYELLARKCFGIYNVASDEKISKYEFAVQYLKAMNIETKYIKPFSIAEKPKAVVRPQCMTLSNEKIKKTINYQFGSVISGFQKLKKESQQEIKLEIKLESTVKSMIHYGQHSIDQSDIDAVVSVLKSSSLTQGPEIEKFEKAVADLVGAKYAVAVMNWTAGIHISCEALGLGAGDYMVTSPLTFCASSNGALYCKANPLFADIDPETLNINPAKIDELLRKNNKIKIIMPVHFAGLACDMKEIHQIAQKYNVKVVEDAAHAIGGKYTDGSMIGNCKYSDIVGFSFHPVKNIACGEGGLMTTNNFDVYKTLLRLRSHGINKLDDMLISSEALTNGQRNQWYHEMQSLGYNYRMTEMQAVLGTSQLKKIDQFLNRRIAIAERYESEFKDLKNLTIPQFGHRKSSGNHLFVVRVQFDKLGKTRYQVIEELKVLGIQGHVHYLPVPMMPYYRENFDIGLDSYKEALSYYKEALTLPLYPAMTDDQVKQVIQAVKKVIG